jgi:hypothetical protein
MTGATNIEAKKRLCRSEHTFPVVLGAMLSAGILVAIDCITVADQIWLGVRFRLTALKSNPRRYVSVCR